MADERAMVAILLAEHPFLSNALNIEKLNAKMLDNSLHSVKAIRLDLINYVAGSND